MGNSFGLPVGISFMGTAFREPTLIKLASGFEHAAQARRPPEFLGKLPFDSGFCTSNPSAPAKGPSKRARQSKTIPDIRKMRPKHM